METMKIISNNPELIKIIFPMLMGIYIITTLLEMAAINKRRTKLEQCLSVLKRGKNHVEEE